MENNMITIAKDEYDALRAALLRLEMLRDYIDSTDSYIDKRYAALLLGIRLEEQE